jgi:hypothetical protein
MWLKAKTIPIRHPSPPFKWLKAEGENVPDCLYWRRRMERGDCIPIDPPKPESEPVTKPTKAAKE